MRVFHVLVLTLGVAGCVAPQKPAVVTAPPEIITDVQVLPWEFAPSTRSTELADRSLVVVTATLSGSSTSAIYMSAPTAAMALDEEYAIYLGDDDSDRLALTDIQAIAHVGDVEIGVMRFGARGGNDQQLDLVFTWSDDSNHEVRLPLARRVPNTEDHVDSHMIGFPLQIGDIVDVGASRVKYCGEGDLGLSTISATEQKVAGGVQTTPTAVLLEVLNGQEVRNRLVYGVVRPDGTADCNIIVRELADESFVTEVITR